MPSKEENARNGLPETDWRDAQYDMLYLPVQKPSATTTISTATVPLPSCPTVDRSTTCTTVAGTYTKSASTTKSLPKSNAHRVNSPAVTNSIPSSPKKRRSFRRPRRGNWIRLGRQIYLSTPIPTTTSPWHRFAIGQPKTKKASNKPLLPLR